MEQLLAKDWRNGLTFGIRLIIVVQRCVKNSDRNLAHERQDSVPEKDFSLYFVSMGNFESV